MLNQIKVNAEEEQLRQRVNNLSDAAREQFYLKFKQLVKDPDTYAVLNWCFVAGMHHFYLGAWLRGCVNLLVSLFGMCLLFTPLWLMGVVMLIVLSVAEFWTLFHSQIIIQDYNNKLMHKLINANSALIP